MIRSVLAALGLSTASGLNATLTLLIASLLAGWTDLVHFRPPYDFLTDPTAQLVLAILAVLEIVGDKIPVVDHAWHAVGLVVHPTVGAVLSMGVSHDVNPTVVAVCGLVLSLATHGTRAALRPFVTALTAGLGNSLVSLIEDAIALVLAVLAVVAPVVACLAIVAGTFLFARTIGRAWRRLFRKKLRPPPLPRRQLRPPPLPRRK